jgi:hypothetical protein
LIIENNRGLHHSLFYLFIFLENFSASATSGGRYNKMTEMKTLSYIKMLCLHQPNPGPLEKKLMPNAAVPLLATGRMGSD